MLVLTEVHNLPEGLLFVMYVLWVWTYVQDMYLLLQHHTAWFPCNTNPLCFTIHSSSSLPHSWKPLIFLLVA